MSDTAEMLRIVAQWTATHYPHAKASRLSIEFADIDAAVVLPIPHAHCGKGSCHDHHRHATVAATDELVEEKGRPVSPVVVDIMTVLTEAGRPLTQYAVCAAMAQHKPPMEWNQRTVAGYLAAMVKDGMLVNPEGSKPPGYRLPE